jgi:uncharacterized protein
MFSMFNKGNVFFDLFEQSAQNVHEGANLLTGLLNDFQDVPNRVRQIHNIEHQGDEFTHRILDQLAKTFITPLDREDIQRIATRLDDVLDQMNTAANRLMLFKVQTIPDDAKLLGKVLIDSTALLIGAMQNLQNLKKRDAIIDDCIRIHTLENEGDRLMQHALAALFDAPNPDPVEIIKWKDIFQILEKATDRCEDVADALQTVVVKYG